MTSIRTRLAKLAATAAFAVGLGLAATAGPASAANSWAGSAPPAAAEDGAGTDALIASDDGTPDAWASPTDQTTNGGISAI